MSLLFDTEALLAFFNDEEGAEEVEKLLSEVDSGQLDGYISAITLTEVFYLYSREKGRKVAEERVEQIRLSNLKIIPINEDVAVKAGEYKTIGIPIADALIGASAWFVNAKVVTSDEHFEEMSGIEVVKFR